MSESEKNIPIQATKSMHVEVNLSDNISSEELDFIINISNIPILPLSEIL
jgi:hypothetical protein